MCFNCAGQLLALDPMPPTLAELRQLVSRERRNNERRWGKPDGRVFRYERRVGQRRTSRDDFPLVDDDMIITVELDVHGLGEDGMEFDELTSIHELGVHPTPVGLAAR